MTHQDMWAAYRAVNPAAGDDYEAWAYGSDPDGLAELTRTGVKTATSSAGPLYDLEGEPLPRAGECSVILNSRDEAVCIIRTTKVYTVPFREVSAGHAYQEGEGDRSLAYWRRVHEDFFRAELAEAGLAFSRSMPVVCEEFEVVYPSSETKFRGNCHASPVRDAVLTPPTPGKPSGACGPFLVFPSLWS